MKVLWLLDSLTLGGAEVVAASFLRHAADFGIDAELCCLKTLRGNPFEEALRHEGLPVRNLEARNLRDRAAFGRLVEHIRRTGPDVLHLHLTYATIWGLLAAKRCGRPAVATLHGGPVPVSSWSREGLRQRWMANLLRRRAVRVLAVSEAVREAWRRHGRLSSEALEVLPNGVPLPAACPSRAASGAERRALGLPDGDPLIVTVATLRGGKGVDTLLAASSRVLAARPGMRLAVVGEGPLRSELEEQAARLGLEDSVSWLGLRHDVPALLAAADVFVLASDHDALPTALLEAMATRTPVVASRVGGIPEIVRDGTTGLLVPPRDPGALAAALSRLAGDPSERQRLGAAGYQRVREGFSLEIWLERLRGVYRSVSEARPRERPA